jgi:hypothetical protein
MALVTSEKGYYGVVEGRNILKSGCIGKWTPEDVNDLINETLKLVKGFGPGKWANIVDPSKMYPILSKETGQAFMDLHKKFAEAGCIAVAFLDAKTAATRLQTQKYQEKSGVQESETRHFKTEQEALEWLSEKGV